MPEHGFQLGDRVQLTWLARQLRPNRTGVITRMREGHVYLRLDREYRHLGRGGWVHYTSLTPATEARYGGAG